jgi:hypothetical protein
MEVFEWPRSIQIVPIFFSSLLNVANAEDKGVGTKDSIEIFWLSITFL